MAPAVAATLEPANFASDQWEYPTFQILEHREIYIISVQKQWFCQIIGNGQGSIHFNISSVLFFKKFRFWRLGTIANINKWEYGLMQFQGTNQYYAEPPIMGIIYIIFQLKIICALSYLVNMMDIGQ